MPICRYFIQGKCKYGSQCANEHPRVSQPTALTSSQYQTSPAAPRPPSSSQRIRQPFQSENHRSNAVDSSFQHKGPWRPQYSGQGRGHYEDSGNRPPAPSTPANQTSQSRIKPEDVILHDLTAVNLQWPLGCYGLNVSWDHGDNIIKGDYSPEELRCEAYAQIRTQGNIDNYCATLSHALTERHRLIEDLKTNPSRALALARMPHSYSQTDSINVQRGSVPLTSTPIHPSQLFKSNVPSSIPSHLSQSSVPTSIPPHPSSNNSELTLNFTPVVPLSSDIDYDSFTFGNIPEAPPP